MRRTSGVFFVTVDPERDTVANLRDYISNFDPRIDALVPTMEQLPKVAASFRIYYAKVPTSDGGLPWTIWRRSSSWERRKVRRHHRLWRSRRIAGGKTAQTFERNVNG